MEGLTGIDSIDEDSILFGSPFRILVQPAIAQRSRHRWRVAEEAGGGGGMWVGWEPGEGIQSRPTTGYLCVG